MVLPQKRPANEVNNNSNNSNKNVRGETEDADTGGDDVSDTLVKELANHQIHRLTVIMCLLVVLSYVVGYFQLTFLVPILLCLYAVWIWKLKTKEIHDWFYNEHEMREHRRRALEHAETAEWVNFLLNRWWFFSDETINALLKKSLDPIFESCKPKVIESIELEKFTLGNRTPYLKYFRVYDLTEDQRKMMATEVIYRNPPVDLPIRPKYQIAVDADFGLDSPEAQMIIRMKLSSKLGFTDIVIDKLKIRGRIQLILQFNQNIQFPHLAAVTFSFLQEPKVSFDIRMLKKIQLMEFPLIRSWITELVNDSLKVSMVDPGHITIPLCNDPELLGRQSGYCEGVLTITIKGGSKGRATSDDQWCSVTLDKQKLRTKEISTDVLWQEQVSLLVYSLQYDKIRIKIKGKRRFGPNYTVVEYILPLIRMNLEQDNEQQMELQDDNIEGSLLHIQLNYSSLPMIDVSSEIDQETFQTNFIDKYYDDTPAEVTGVLFICVHSGTNLIPMDSSGTSDPYVMVFANKELVQMGHVVDETLNPQWDTRVEFFTTDYTETTLSFVVMDRNPMVLPNVLLADDNDDFMGSCNLKLTKDDYCVFKRDLDLSLKFFGDQKKRTQEIVKKVGTLTVSVIFRPVSFIKNSIKSTVNEGFVEGEPLHQKRTKLDAVTMEAILRQERGSLTISILRARNLMALDLNGRSDPFVIVRVGSGKQEKFKTKVVYRTLNPVWNEQITLAMPQKHERVCVEVWDKDPLSQERLGSTHFNHDDLLHLGANENEKHWFDLDKAKSGEIQLQFTVVMPNTDRLDGIHEDDEHIEHTYSYGTDNSEEDFLILEQKQKPDILVTSHEDDDVTPSGSNKELHRQGAFSNSLEVSTESNGKYDKENGFIDFSGEPSKYYGLHGEILELICLNLHDIDEVYIKIKIDNIAKFSKPTRRTILPKSERVLCRTSFYQVETRMRINEQFQTKSDSGVSPCLYLIIEIKSEKKGKDVIDSHSMLLRNFFKGESSVVRTIELDNGGKIKLQLGHVIPKSPPASGLRKKYSFKKAKFRNSIH